MSDFSWTDELVEQLDWHWTQQARPRLEGLTDEEYFFEPVANCWNLRPRGTSSTPMAVGAGELTIDYAHPEPEPAPVTTIAWRISHLLVGVLGARLHGHFGGDEVSYESYDYPTTAAAALQQLDAMYARWIEGVRGADEAKLKAPVGQAEPYWPDSSFASLVLHINREMIHHLAEIALLRDLYANGLRGA